jgi:hypothetical protein
MNNISLGKWLGVEITLSPWALVAYLALALVCSMLAAVWRDLTWLGSLQAGAWSAVVFFFSDLAHQYGHYRAGRAVGYPFTRLHFHSIFSACIYPADEPPLPPQTHIRRALGGFWINVLLGGAFLPYAIMIFFTEGGDVGAWVILFLVVSNILILGFGALLPIDLPGVFTVDGGTIWRYWRETRHNTPQG